MLLDKGGSKHSNIICKKLNFQNKLSYCSHLVHLPSNIGTFQWFILYYEILRIIQYHIFINGRYKFPLIVLVEQLFQLLKAITLTDPLIIFTGTGDISHCKSNTVYTIFHIAMAAVLWFLTLGLFLVLCDSCSWSPRVDQQDFCSARYGKLKIQDLICCFKHTIESYKIIFRFVLSKIKMN